MDVDYPLVHRRERTTLDRGGAPLYRQLAADLRARILEGEFSQGTSIPTEARLSEGYRTSRITVRHALSLLEQEGLVHREQGRGSFVRPRPIAVGPRRLTSFSQELRERGARHGSRLISVTEGPAPTDAPLDLGPSGDCVRIVRVRKGDDRPIALQVTHIPAELGQGITDALAHDGSLYDFLRSRHGLEVDSADETYRVGGASEQAAASLDLIVGAPVFIVERVGFARARRVEWTSSVVRGEDYEVHVHLKR
jgi:GntR family transcriptional regulator